MRQLARRGAEAARPRLVVGNAAALRVHRAVCRAAPPAQAAVASEPPPGLLPVPWTGSPEQEQALSDLRERMRSSPYGCPGDELLRWYLRDRYFSAADAEAKLTSMLRWRRDEDIDGVDLSDPQVQKEMATGKAYVHTEPDRFGRPVVVIRVRNHVIGEFPIEASKRLCGAMLDRAMGALPPGGEQILGIFDLRGFELRNADLQFTAFIIEAFFEYYPRRMGQVLMVDAPWIFRPTWEVIKPLLRKYSALVRFVDRKQLPEYFDEKTLPEEFRS